MGEGRGLRKDERGRGRRELSVERMGGRCYVVISVIHCLCVREH